MKSKKVDLIIVGAQKAGTTSLNNYLRSHPSISGHETIEFSFFANKEEWDKGFESAYDTYFENSGAQRVVAKNVTISLDKDSLPRLKKHNPDAKIVFLLREPVSRAYSAYTMAVKNGWMKRSFTEFKDLLANNKYDDIMYRHFVGHGIYSKQLELLLKYFPKENIRLYLFEEFKKTPQLICNDIFSWLNISNHIIENEIHNPTYQPKSGFVGALIDGIKNEQNPIKKVVKAFLPNIIFQKIGGAISNLNTTKKKFSPIDPEIKELLSEHFNPLNEDLGNVITKQEGILKTFAPDNKNNWLK